MASFATTKVADIARAPWTHWLLVGVSGLLLGLIVAIGLQRRPRALLPHEREAVLGKLRGWLADGGATS
jgi:flagellar M-ring protein FliF